PGAGGRLGALQRVHGGGRPAAALPRRPRDAHRGRGAPLARRHGRTRARRAALAPAAARRRGPRGARPRAARRRPAAGPPGGPGVRARPRRPAAGGGGGGGLGAAGRGRVGAVRRLRPGAAGRDFVDELLDSEPNRLGEEFRERLASLTEGLPLFVVELLEEMRAAGELARDDTGAWVVASAIGWHALPARVEGVIRARLERLDPDLVEALRVGSVEGATFAAEVVARVLGCDARQLARRLSGAGEKEHQLLEGVEVARDGGRRLTRFRFRHDLFHRYVYAGLSPLDRALLHEEVGAALEELHADDTTVVAVDLARHWEEAGIGGRAARYVVEAGRQASALYAFDEAGAHLRRALRLLDD